MHFYPYFTDEKIEAQKGEAISQSAVGLQWTHVNLTPLQNLLTEAGGNSPEHNKQKQMS